MSGYRQGDWRPLSKALGTETSVKIDADGDATIKTEGEDAPTLDYAKALRDQAAHDGGYVPGMTGNVKRVASIPAALQVKWLVEEGIDVYNPDHAERVMRKLNDPDYAYLRTAPGRLAMVDGEKFR